MKLPDPVARLAGQQPRLEADERDGVRGTHDRARRRAALRQQAGRNIERHHRCRMAVGGLDQRVVGRTRRAAQAGA